MKNYNVRDGRDWEAMLGLRLKGRLRNSKNLVLFLSSVTKNSRALREEMEYGIGSQGLPVIVVYPDFSSNDDLVDSAGYFREPVCRLWDKLPSFREYRKGVACAHVPLEKALIVSALSDPSFTVQHMKRSGDYVL